ncbi:hypothetical protein D3C87_914800 [compost metagenome]
MLITLLTARLQELMTDDANTCAAPNLISESVYELCIDHGLSEDKADKISDACFEFASELVTVDKNNDFCYM